MATYRDIQLDADGDIDLSDGRSFAWVADVPAIAHHAKFRLQQVKGEWMLDTDAGMDWFGQILGLGITDSQVEAEVRRVLDGTPGIASVYSVEMTRDRGQRSISIAVQATSDTGELLSLTAEMG